MKGKELAGYLKLLAYLELAFGIVGSIIIAYQQGTEVKTSYSSFFGYSYETIRNMPLTLGIFAGLAFSVIVLFLLILVVGIILENQIYIAELLENGKHALEDSDKASFASSNDKIDSTKTEDIPIDNLPDI